MVVVTSHQSGSTQVRPLAIAAAAGVAVAVLIGFAASSGMLLGKNAPPRDEVPLQKSDLKPTQPGVCALCGTVESLRSVEVYDEPGTSGAGPEPQSASENPGAGPGGAIANSAVTMPDSLSGNAGDKGVRKRIVWRVTLRMDDGSYRAISLPTPPAFSVGEKVRVVEGRLVRA